MRVQNATRSGRCRALVAQGIERSPAKAEVVGSNPAKRAIPARRRGRDRDGKVCSARDACGRLAQLVRARR